MRILCIGTYDLGKPRTRLLLDALRHCGYEVEEIHRNLWGGIEDKSQVKGLRYRLFLLVRAMAAYPVLIWKLLVARRCDWVLFPYLGLVDLRILGTVARMRRFPVAIDAFISLYDTVVMDRRLVPESAWQARLLKKFEQSTLRKADRVFIDTRAHADFFVETFGLKAETVCPVFVGAERLSFPALPPPRPPGGGSGTFRVLFYGQCIPLHGIETILEAIKLTSDPRIEWILIGKGQEIWRLREFQNQHPEAPITWIEWVPYDELIAHIEAADLCLGIFGASGKAGRVIANKVFQVIQAGRPIVTRDSPAMRELVGPDEPGVILVPPADPHALKNAVQSLAGSPCPLPGDAVRQRFSLNTLASMTRAALEPENLHRDGSRNRTGQFQSVMNAEHLPSQHPHWGRALPESGWVPAPRYLLRRDRIIHHLRRLQPGRFLDIGCGPGALLADAVALGIKAEGLERAEQARALGVQLLAGLDVAIHSMPKSVWQQEGFDLVGAFEVLEHIEEDRRALREWRQYLKPGGRLLISVPAHPSLFNAADVWAGHYRRYTRAELIGKLQDAGYAVEVVECYGFPLATILELPRAWVYGRQLKDRQQSPETGDADRTAQSGTNRSVDSRFWPWIASPVGVFILRTAALAQIPFLRTPLGNGFLVLARRND